MQKGRANVDFVKCCSSTCLLSTCLSCLRYEAWMRKKTAFTEEYSHPRHWQNTEVYRNLFIMALWGVSKCISIFRSSYQHFKDKVA